MMHGFELDAWLIAYPRKIAARLQTTLKIFQEIKNGSHKSKQIFSNYETLEEFSDILAYLSNSLESFKLI